MGAAPRCLIGTGKRIEKKKRGGKNVSKKSVALAARITIE